LRCFVACWPDDSTRRRLDQAAGNALARCPGARRVRADNLHLTLAFIGELAPPKAGEVAEALRRVASEPFEWRVDHIGRFERARVMWAGGPPEPRLEQLAERARSELRALRIRFDTKRFAAHVTLLRDVPALGSAGEAETIETIEPFDWPIRGALLMVSERDAHGATRYRAFASP
jgi:RNA 2',3'-cyclic 3'-phosphodiesterase